jgi:parallel beta-helix repeat protein
MKRVLTVVVVLSMSLLGIGLRSAPSFAGEAVTCGATVTTNTTLHRDLVNCPGNGIVIGADDITLDLNGHTIDGDGVLSDCPPENVDFCDLGVDNTAGHTGVTVKGGSISDFTHGVLDEGSNNVLRGLSVSNSFGSGIALLNAQNDRVTGSFLHDNGLTQEAQGVIVFFGSGNQVDGNLLSNNGDTGVFLRASDDNRVTNNSLVGNRNAGVATTGGIGNQVSSNHIAGSQFLGIVIDGDHNLVKNNQMSLPTGCPDACSFGISFEGGTGNLLTGNVINGGDYGIRVDAFTADVDGTQIRDNVVRASGIDGIVIDLEHPGPVLDTLVVGNSVAGAGVDGIQVNSASTTITHNVANHNGNLGIEAVPGVTDGGGNHAAGNGNPLQCTNVKCS